MKTPHSIFVLATAIVIIFTIASMANATIVDLYPLDQGTFMHDGVHYYNSTNYSAGNDIGNREFRSFFVFDLSYLLLSTITSANLTVFLPSGGYNSPDSYETYTLYDVLDENIEDLIGDTSLITDMGIFEDLGTGDIYGEATVFKSNEGSIIDIALGSEAILDLNNGIGGYFAIGAAVTSLDHNGEGVQEVIFVNTQDVSLENTSLSIEGTPIPEPTTMVLLGAGLLGLAGLGRKKFFRKD